MSGVPSFTDRKRKFAEPEPSAGAASDRAPAVLDRRRFLEAVGFSLSLTALAGCSRAPVQVALPLVEQPEGFVAGRGRSYATTCGGCPAGCGLLATVRDGRPLKMEGMPEHPLSAGGLCAVGQALPMGLYDSRRLQQPVAAGQPSDWKSVDEKIVAALAKIQADGGAVRFVTPTLTSPTLQGAIDRFLERHRNAKHVVWDAAGGSAILDSHARTHGVRILPRYRFDKARVIVSFGADFLGAWISPVEFTAGWRHGRTPTPERREMSRHYQLEGRMSLAGTKADRRVRLAPSDYGAALSRLYVDLARRAGVEPPAGAESSGNDVLPADLANELADQLWSARGAALVVSDSQDVRVQTLVNGVNHLLDGYGNTLDIERPSRQRQGNDAALLDLLKELESGEVAALFVSGLDLTHNLPDRERVATHIQGVPLVVSLAERVDDFASLAGFVCPDHHPLESWLDAEPVDGQLSLFQPLIQPLGQTRSILESLAVWSGEPATADSILRQHWEREILPRAGGGQFQPFWDKSVHDGIVTVAPRATATAGEFKASAIELMPATTAKNGFELELVSRVGLPDSRHAHNPWLQELPDPITKLTWDNAVSLSPAAAGKLGVTDGDVLRVSAGDVAIELPALIQPGQHDRVLSISLGYGVRGTDRFALVGPQWFEARPTVAPGETVGRNAAPFLVASGGTLQPVRQDVTVAKTGRRRDLATTQDHHRVEAPPHVAPRGAERREIVQRTTLAAYRHDPHAGAPAAHHDDGPDLWPEDHPRPGHAWGMAIDLNACTGCSACVVACQSENNVPVVGRDEVLRQREMHWIRIDRYYSGEDDDVAVDHQPMMCQHCGHAPCETVCPVLATVHSQEGLNEQAYNRCVGTRYCANNCPYKTRRFNWFDYPRDDALQRLLLNPDVTVRTRGVMEKCSLCVQRIEDGRIEARRQGTPIADGAIRTACQQSCPARAIVFGDVNDPASAVSRALADPRRFGVLEEFNFRPAVSYLRIVRNRESDAGAAPAGESHV